MKTFNLLLFTTLLFSCTSSKQLTELKEENKVLKTEVINLNKKIEGLDKQNTEYLIELEKLTKQLNNAK